MQLVELRKAFFIFSLQQKLLPKKKKSKKKKKKGKKMKILLLIHITTKLCFFEALGWEKKNRFPEVPPSPRTNKVKKQNKTKLMMQGKEA